MQALVLIVLVIMAILVMGCASHVTSADTVLIMSSEQKLFDIKKQNKEALKWILNYHEFKQSYIEELAQFSEIGATVNTGLPGGSEVGNPTMKKGIKLVDIEHHKQWLMSVEQMEQTLSEKKKAFLEFRRRAEVLVVEEEKDGAGRPGWTDYVQVKYAEWFDRRYGNESVPSRQTMTDWMNKMVDATVRIAIRNKCL